MSRFKEYPTLAEFEKLSKREKVEQIGKLQKIARNINNSKVELAIKEVIKFLEKI